MDREPSKLLDEAAELIAKASADTAGQAAQRASQATTLSLIVMLAVCAASVVGALLFSRSVVRTNANSVAGDPAKRRPGGRKRRRSRQPEHPGARAGAGRGRVPPAPPRRPGHRLAAVNGPLAHFFIAASAFQISAGGLKGFKPLEPLNPASRWRSSPPAPCARLRCGRRRQRHRAG